MSCFATIRINVTSVLTSEIKLGPLSHITFLFDTFMFPLRKQILALTKYKRNWLSEMQKPVVTSKYLKICANNSADVIITSIQTY